MNYNSTSTYNYGLQLAAKMWWRETGDVPVSQIANQFSVDLNELTLLIQEQIAEKADVCIVDKAPVVHVKSTIEQMTATHVNYGSIREFSIFYALKNPHKMQHDCYLIESV